MFLRDFVSETSSDYFLSVAVLCTNKDTFTSTIRTVSIYLSISLFIYIYTYQVKDK